MTMKAANAQGMEWDFNTGWHPIRKAGWRKDPQRARRVRVTTPKGTQIWAYETEGYDDYIGFHAHDTPIDRESEMGAFVEDAFNEESPSHWKLFFAAAGDSGGHIKYIQYNQNRQCMKVAFRNRGDICVYFRVHRSIAGELLALMRSKAEQRSAVDGKVRHAVGIRFWDLVRIRGQRHGSRYQFEYWQHGVYKLIGSDRITSSVISDKRLKIISQWGDDTGTSKQLETFTGYDYDDNDNRIDQAAVESFDEAVIAKIDNERGTILPEQMYLLETSTPMRKAGSRTYAGVLTQAEEEEYNRLSAKYTAMRKQHQSDALLEQQRLTHINPADEERYINEHGNEKGFMRVTRDEDGNDVMVPDIGKIHRQMFFDMQGDAADRRSWTGKLKKSVIQKMEAFGPRTAFAGNQEEYNRYIFLNQKIKQGTSVQNLQNWTEDHTGRYWTIEELEGMGANPQLPGSVSMEHIVAYRNILKQHDYQAALNFLKSHKANFQYVPNTPHHGHIPSKPLTVLRFYAGKDDKLAPDSNEDIGTTPGSLSQSIRARINSQGGSVAPVSPVPPAPPPEPKKKFDDEKRGYREWSYEDEQAENAEFNMSDDDLRAYIAREAARLQKKRKK